MSLTPTRDDTGIKVTFIKQAGGAIEMPSSIFVYVETMPLLRGVCRKILHTPFFNSLTTQAVETIYTPELGTNIDLIGRYRDVIVPMVRDEGTVAGIIEYGNNVAKLFFRPTAVNGTIDSARIEIETLTY